MQTINVSYNVVIEVGRVAKPLGWSRTKCIVAAGWGACALVWVFAIGFGYSWGPCSWVVVAEVRFQQTLRICTVSDKWFRFGPWVFVERASLLRLPPIGLVVFYRLMMCWLTSLYSIFRWTTLSVSRSTCPSGPVITFISISWSGHAHYAETSQVRDVYFLWRMSNSYL